jgi:hypothetical protein
MPIPCSWRETKGREETDTFSLLNIADINIKAPSQCRRRRRRQIDR